MISPYVRRLRLATEVRALRAEAGLTADQLGKRIGRSRADISRLENGHVVAVDTVTSDLILADPADVHPYQELYQRLREAALPPDDSLDLLTKLAADLPDD